MPALMPGTASRLDAASVTTKEGTLAAVLPREHGGCNLGHSRIEPKVPFVFGIAIVLALGPWPTHPWLSLNPWMLCGHFAFIFSGFSIEDRRKF